MAAVENETLMSDYVNNGFDLMANETCFTYKLYKVNLLLVNSLPATNISFLLMTWTSSTISIKYTKMREEWVNCLNEGGMG